MTQSVRPKKTYRSGATLFRKVGRIGWKKSDHFTYTFAFPRLRRWLVERLQQQKRILSIGCGTGELEKMLESPARTVVGSDLLIEMVRGARRRRVRDLVQADTHWLPFASRAFDAVIVPETLGYIDPKTSLREMHRVLKRGGRLFVTSYPVHIVAHSVYVKRSVAEIRGLLEGAGFSVVEHRFLLLRPGKMQETEDEKRCSLLYVEARVSSTKMATN